MFKIFQETKTIKWVYNQKEFIDFSPTYQRRGSLWKKDQKQLLIDSILNGYDIPKLYFQFMPPMVNNYSYNYAIIDGKQRIEAIISFVQDEFPLSDNFTFLDSDLLSQFGDISGKLFSEIENFAPALIARFWQYELNIVFMDTNNPDAINELFVRLNSGLPVNTTEKRNANGGTLSFKIQELCDISPFFNQKIKITNRRFEHNDLALKLLMLEMGEWDLTKKNVDKFVSDNKAFNACLVAYADLENKINGIAEQFNDKDALLSRKNFIITVYTVLDDIPIQKLRPFCEYFENYRMAIQEQENISEHDAQLVEFTRFLQQGADKKSSIQERSNIMRRYINAFLCNN